MKFSIVFFIMVLFVKTMDFIRNPFQQQFDRLVDTPQNGFTYDNFQTKEENIDRLINFFGGDINYKDDSGMTLLHIVVMTNDVELVTYLLKKGANPNISGYAGYTPLFYSVLLGNCEIVLTMLEHGGDPRISDDYGENCFQISKDSKITNYLYTFFP